MAVSQAEITSALAAFDGRHVAPLRACVSGRVGPDGLATLLAALPGPDERGASWMLKALAESGRLPPAHMPAFLAKLPLLEDADAILHVLQSAQHAPADIARALRPALVPFYGHGRQLLRVWAFDAYCRGADMPAEAADIAERIGLGLGDRSKAMQARARALARDFGLDRRGGS